MINLKKHCKRIAAFVTAVLFVISLSVQVLALNLSVPVYKQEKSNTCWAACVCMVVKFYKPSYGITQEGVVTSVYGGYYNNTATTATITSCINSGLGSNYYSTKYTPLSLSAVQQEIGQGQPIVAVVSNGYDSAHAYIISGYDGDFLTLIDPAQGSRTYAYYSEFCNGSWFWDDRIFSQASYRP